jgi:hypothetical protein
MNKDLSANDNESTEAINWMRNVLTSMLEVCPLSYHQKKVTGQVFNKMPDWLMGRWADVLNIDYIGGRTRYPDMAELAKSDYVRNLAQQYLEAHDAVAVGNCVEDLGKSVLKHDQAGDLPVDSGTIERQVWALAVAGCNAEGPDFVQNAGDILSDRESPNHTIVDYHLALEHGDKQKIKALDAALTGGRYGSWAAERLTEAKRFLGVEPPHFTVRVGERTPQWDLLWKRLFTGGDE